MTVRSTARARDQLRLPLAPRHGHGGARRGAGRKPRGASSGVSHHGRPDVSARTPVHVTLRVLPHVPNLRSAAAFAVVESALAGALRFRDFRVVHFSAQANHLHLLVEAEGSRALSEGMQGLSVRLAKGLNRLTGSRGRVLADRFHARALGTPSEVRRVLSYVLLNARSHEARRGSAVARGRLDPRSSAATFAGFRQVVLPEPPRVTSPPATWLLATGWRRGGLLSIDAVPAGTARRRRGLSPSPAPPSRPARATGASPPRPRR